MKGFKRFLMVVVACVCACFCFACGGDKKNVPATLEEATAKMEAAGYTLEVWGADELEEMSLYFSVEGATSGVDYLKDESEDGMSVVWFEEESQAEACNESYKAIMAAMGESGESGCSGVMFYFGTDAAVDAFTK